MLTALLCTLAVAQTSSRPPVTARLQVQTGSESFAGGAVSPDGRLFAVADGSNMDIRPMTLWEIETGRQTLSFQAPPQPIFGNPVFSPDGNRIAALTGSGLVTWDVVTGQQLDFQPGVTDVVADAGQILTVKGSAISSFDFASLKATPVFEAPANQTIFPLDAKHTLTSDAAGQATLYVGGQKKAEFKFKRRPNAARMASKDSILVDQTYIERNVPDNVWTLIDLRPATPKTHEFKADHLTAYQGGVFGVFEYKGFLREEKDWSKPKAVALPANTTAIELGPDGRSVIAFSDKEYAWVDTKSGQLGPIIAEPENAELSLSDLHFVRGSKTAVAVARGLFVDLNNPIVIDLATGKVQRELLSLAVQPLNPGLTAGSTRLVVDYYRGTEDGSGDGSYTWDLETGELLPPLEPRAEIARETIPEATANYMTVLSGDRLFDYNRLLTTEKDAYKSDLLTTSSILGLYGEFLAVHRGISIQGESEEGDVKGEVLLLPWMAPNEEPIVFSYSYFFDVTRAPGAGMFWLCVDGRLFLLPGLTGETEVFEDIPMPLFEDAEKKFTDPLVDPRFDLDLSATPDNSLLLAVHHGSFFRFPNVEEGKPLPTPVIEFLGSATVFNRSTKEWKRIQIDEATSPTAGALARNGRTAYITTRDGRLLKCSVDGLAVEAELNLDSAGSGLILDENRGFAFVATKTGVNLVDLQEWKVSANLIAMRDGSWTVVGSDGRFDTSDPDRAQGLYWLFSDRPNQPLPIEVLMRDYYEPRLLSRLLGREKFAPVRPVSEVLRELPVLKVLEVKKVFSDEVEVRVEIDATKTSAHDLRLLRNGRLVAQVDGEVCAQGQKKEIWLKEIGVPQDGKGTLEFSAYAFNVQRGKSETASLTVPFETEAKKGNALVLTIGVNDYEDKSWNLQYAAADAKASAAILEACLHASGKFDEVGVVTLVSEGETKEATKARIKEVFEALLDESSPEDTLVIHWAGHGYAAANGQFYLVPSDIGASFDVNRPGDLERAVSSDELAQWIRPIDADQIVMIVDACHSAATVQAEGFKPGPMGAKGLGQLAYDKGMMIIAATQTADFALESGTIGHGLLTYSMAITGLLLGDGNKGQVFHTFSRDGKTASFRDLFDFGAYLVPVLHEYLANGQMTLARTSRVTYKKDQRPGAQTPQIFDFSRRVPPLVLGSNPDADPVKRR